MATHWPIPVLYYPSDGGAHFLFVEPLVAFLHPPLLYLSGGPAV